MNIGLLFGSFNPVHIGHLALANYLLEYVPFEQIWFIVSPQNPFKEEDGLAQPQHRLSMVTHAISPEPRMIASDIEFELPRPSYTIDTLKVLGKRYPQHHFNLIMGSDNLTHLNRWKSWEQLIANYPILVYPRPGHPLPATGTFPHANIKSIEAPLLEISSTLVRKGLMEGKKLNFLMPPGIMKYISDHHLYGT